MDADVLLMQRNALFAALKKLLDSNEKEAKAAISYRTARENFSEDSYERREHEKAMLEAMAATREARTLLLTLRIDP